MQNVVVSAIDTAIFDLIMMIEQNLLLLNWESEGMKKVLLNRNSDDVDLNIIRQADGWPLMEIIPFLCNIAELESIISFRVCQ